MSTGADGPLGTMITLERTYGASPDDVWALCTTREGIESWWGPEGFSAKVHALDLKPGGELRYAMTAVDPDQVAFMRNAGMPLTTETRLTYAEVEPSVVSPTPITRTSSPGSPPTPSEPGSNFTRKKAGCAWFCVSIPCTRRFGRTAPSWAMKANFESWPG